MDLSLVASSSNWMLGLVKRRFFNAKFWLFNIYGPISIVEKRKLWERLVVIASLLKGTFLIYGGDFNAI